MGGEELQKWDFHSLPPVFCPSKEPIQTRGEVKPMWKIYQGSPTNSPQTEEATWMSSEMFQPNKKDV